MMSECLLEPKDIKRLLRYGVLCTAAVIATWPVGCVVPDPIGVWKDSLATYVAREGHGNPNILRETVDLRSRRGLRPARVTFAKTRIPGPGFPLSGASRDVTGVLVGLTEVDTCRWFVFIVGVLSRHPGAPDDLEDVRVASFTIDRACSRWHVCPPNPKALAKYRALQPAGRQGAQVDGISLQAFPRPTDLFHLAGSGSTVTVTEQESQASWSLELLDAESPAE